MALIIRHFVITMYSPQEHYTRAFYAFAPQYIPGDCFIWENFFFVNLDENKETHVFLDTILYRASTIRCQKNPPHPRSDNCVCCVRVKANTVPQCKHETGYALYSGNVWQDTSMQRTRDRKQQRKKNVKMRAHVVLKKAILEAFRRGWGGNVAHVEEQNISFVPELYTLFFSSINKLFYSELWMRGWGGIRREVKYLFCAEVILSFSIR